MINQPWECPRCNKIKAPHVDECNCAGTTENPWAPQIPWPSTPLPWTPPITPTPSPWIPMPGPTWPPNSTPGWPYGDDPYTYPIVIC